MARRTEDKEEPGKNVREERDVLLHRTFLADLIYWAETDPKIERRLLRMVEEIRHEPFTGAGKPEPMKHDMRGCWSRRLTDEHRIVYRVTGNLVHMLQGRLHYRP